MTRLPGVVSDIYLDRNSRQFLLHFLVAGHDILLELLVHLGIGREHGLDLYALFTVKIVLGYLPDQPVKTD